jgi:hypothetical protein
VFLGVSWPILHHATDTPPTLGMYVLPRGHDSTPADILAGGYRVCTLLDLYPSERDVAQVERLYYHGGNTVDGRITYEGEMFIVYATEFLCTRHSDLFEIY